MKNITNIELAGLFFGVLALGFVLRAFLSNTPRDKFAADIFAAALCSGLLTALVFAGK